MVASPLQTEANVTDNETPEENKETTPAPEAEAEAESPPPPPAEKSSEDQLKEAAGEAAQATKKMLSGLGKVIKEKAAEIDTDELKGKLKSIGGGSSEDGESSPGVDEETTQDPAFIGPAIPFLHGSIGQQRLVAVGLASLLTLIMVINMGGWGFVAGGALCSFALTSAVILLLTSRARVKFTNFTNCLNVMLIATFILMVLGKLLGDALMNVDPTEMAKFLKKYERNTFGVGLFMFTLYCAGFFPAGRLVWSRSLKDVWKAGTIVTILQALWYLVVMPYLVLAAYDWAKSLI